MDKQPETLAEAKQHLRDHWEKGVDCPACGRIVKLYKYNMNAGMALSVISMYKLTKKHNPEGGWIHVQQAFAKELGLNANALHYSLMKWWDLLIPSTENPDPSKRASGFWCITKKGIDFVEERITVPAKVHIYDNKLVGFDEEHINIRDALKKKFDYDELMNG